MNKKTYSLLEKLQTLGFSWEESCQLRRIEMTLQRWAELECGDGNDRCSWSIERDEATNKPFRCVYPHTGTMRRYPVADRERGALKRLAAIMAKHPELLAYHQTDCRGCMVYILRRTDLAEGDKVDSVYTRGLAVCS